jgi:DnaK suppressor protein
MNAHSKAGGLTAQEIRDCAARLSQRLAMLRAAQRDHVEAGNRGAKEAASAEVHDLKDEAFAGQLANLSGMALHQLQLEMAAVQAAQHRIHDGSYGRCSDCGLEIGHERLLAQPSAERCMHCQERVEKPTATR